MYVIFYFTVLFLIYINDLPDYINLVALLFSNDTTPADLSDAINELVPKITVTLNFKK
jgi:hypothetical protein